MTSLLRKIYGEREGLSQSRTRLPARKSSAERNTLLDMPAAVALETSDKGAYVSPYLLQPSKPKPRFFPGDIFNPSDAKKCRVRSVRWDKDRWIYELDD